MTFGLYRVLCRGCDSASGISHSVGVESAGQPVLCQADDTRRHDGARTGIEYNVHDNVMQYRTDRYRYLSLPCGQLQRAGQPGAANLMRMSKKNLARMVAILAILSVSRECIGILNIFYKKVFRSTPPRHGDTLILRLRDPVKSQIQYRYSTDTVQIQYRTGTALVQH